MAQETVVAATGHRPPKAGITYGLDGQVDRDYLLKVKWALEEEQPSSVIVGGALGWDTLVARAAFLSHIPFRLYVPFEGQESRWPAPAQERYRLMRADAAEVRVICEGGYAAYKMQLRNMAMVNDCTEVWALWDGSTGGTANCVEYAKAIGKPVRNFYSSSSSLSPIQA